MTDPERPDPQPVDEPVEVRPGEQPEPTDAPPPLPPLRPEVPISARTVRNVHRQRRIIS